MLKIGILKQMRGNNFKDKEIGKKIKNLWCEALKELELQDKTTLKENILYGIYTEYESNYKGDYTFFIGGDRVEKKIFYMEFILSMKVIIRETTLFL